MRTRGQLKKTALGSNRVVAIDSLGIHDARGWRNTGARACAASHQRAWRSAWKIGLESAVIFEDDVILSPDFKYRLEHLKLPEDWAICYFGCAFLDPPILTGLGLLRVGRTWDMHAYLIRKSFAQLLRPSLRQSSQRRLGVTVPSEERTAIDLILSDHHKTHAAYAVWPPMAWQAEGLSNIEHSYRGNYHPDGRQRINEEAITHLPWTEGDEETFLDEQPSRFSSAKSIKVTKWGTIEPALAERERNTFPENPMISSNNLPTKSNPGGRRLQLGCGENQLADWENWDLPQVDIRRELPFGDASAEAVFLEHVIEHVTPQEGYRFFAECMRVLQPGGVLRLAFPDPVRILRQATPGYLSWQKAKGWGDGTAASGVRAALFLHGHQNVCTAEVLTCELESLGFTVTEHRPRESGLEGMRNLESHGFRDPAKWESTLCQTTCLEAVKPS